MQCTANIYVIRKAILGTVAAIEYKIITRGRLRRKKKTKNKKVKTKALVSITLT